MTAIHPEPIRPDLLALDSTRETTPLPSRSDRRLPTRRHVWDACVVVLQWRFWQFCAPVAFVVLSVGFPIGLTGGWMHCAGSHAPLPAMVLSIMVSWMVLGMQCTLVCPCIHRDDGCLFVFGSVHVCAGICLLALNGNVFVQHRHHPPPAIVGSVYGLLNVVLGGDMVRLTWRHGGNRQTGQIPSERVHQSGKLDCGS